MIWHRGFNSNHHRSVRNDVIPVTVVITILLPFNKEKITFNSAQVAHLYIKLVPMQNSHNSFVSIFSVVIEHI